MEVIPRRWEERRWSYEAGLWAWVGGVAVGGTASGVRGITIAIGVRGAFKDEWTQRKEGVADGASYISITIDVMMVTGFGKLEGVAGGVNVSNTIMLSW